MPVFTHHKKFMTRKVDEVGGVPVYAFACGREENIIVHEARLIDYLLIEDVYVPVYGIARECCLGIEEDLVETCLFDEEENPIGIPKTLRAQVYVNELTNQNQHCGAPECDTFLMTYNGTAWVGGSANFTSGSLSFSLTCQPEADPSERWKLEITGCSTHTVYFASFFNGCGALYLQKTLLEIDGEGCCDCPQITPRITFYIEGLTNQWVRMARLIDYVMDGSTLKPVYGFAECCDDEGVTYAPRCCVRLPCTIYAELTSSCACLDGAVIELTFNPGGFTQGWSGSVVLECGTISVTVLCSTNGTIDEEFVPDEENPCQEMVICEPQGYGSCDEPRYLSGNFSVGVACGGILFSQAEVLCNECDCDPFSEEIALVFAAGSPSCGCDEEDTATIQLSI